MKKIIIIVLLFASKVYANGIISSINNISSTTIPLYSKFETGISLTKTFTNPYNPDIISIEAQFTSPTGKLYTVYGFYYQDYQKIITAPFWNPITTPFPWRIRFSPNETGTWSYTIAAKENISNTTGTTSLQTFVCTNSTNPGYLSVSSNKRYLQYSNGSSFFGIAEDLRAFSNTQPATLQDCASNNVSCTDWCYTPNTLVKHKEWINDFKNNGGNLVRIWLEPYSYEIEWENLNNYSNRQNRAYDFDELIEYLSTNKVYTHLVLYNEFMLRKKDTLSTNDQWMIIDETHRREWSLRFRKNYRITRAGRLGLLLCRQPASLATVSAGGRVTRKI